MSADASSSNVPHQQQQPQPQSMEGVHATAVAANGAAQPGAAQSVASSNGASTYVSAATAQPSSQQHAADVDMTASDMPPLQADPSITVQLPDPASAPRPAIAFAIRDSQPRKRRQPLVDDPSNSSLQQIVKQAKLDAAAELKRPPPPPPPAPSPSYKPTAADQAAHAAARDRLRAQMMQARPGPPPSSSSTSSSPAGSSSGVVDSTASKASRLLNSGDPSIPLPPTALVYYMAENEKAKMQSRYQALVTRRQKEKEQQAKDSSASSRNKQPPAPPTPSLLSRLADECLQMNVSNHFPTGKDSRGVDTFTSTRFRGGSAIDSLLARDAQAAGAGQPSVGWQVSFTLCMYQQGFSINSEDSDWQEYSDANLRMLHAIDNGLIPPYITTLAPSFNLAFYDGHLICEVRDYRNVQLSVGQREPRVRRLLLRPTQESLMMDVKQCVAEAGLHDGAEWAELAVEAEVVRLVRSRLCLWNSVRVCQVLNLAAMNRSKGVALRLTGDVADERTMELWQTMGETMFGLDAPLVEGEGGEERREDDRGKDREKEREKREDGAEQRVAQLLRRGAVLPKRVREKLLRLQAKQEQARVRARKEMEAMTQRMKQEERLEEEEDERIKTQLPVIKADPAALAASQPLPEHPLPPHIAQPVQSHFLPLLAYAAFCSQTSVARHNAAANVLLLDPEARKRELSGPQGQAMRAQAVYARAMESYKKEAATGVAGSGGAASLQPPQYKKPLTIVSKVDPVPLQDRTLKNPNVLPVDEWTQYSFTSPISGRDREGRAVASQLTLAVDVYVHAIPAPPCGSMAALASGRYECYVRQTVVGAGEAPGAPQCVAEGSKDEIRVFVREFVRTLQREGGLQAGKESVVTGQRPMRLPTDNVMREVEERGERMKALDEHMQQQRQAAQQAAAQAQAAQAQQAAQAAATQPQQPMGAGGSAAAPQLNGYAGAPPSAAAAAAANAASGGRRHPAGKQPAGAASSLGLPSGYAPSQTRREEAPPAASGRMPAGYHAGGVSGMRPGGGGAGTEASAAASPPPLQHGSATPPATFPPPAVPPPYHAHHQQGLQPSRSVPGHSAAAAPTPGQPAAQPQLTPEQARAREQQHRALQQQRYQQQLLRQQQQQAGGYPPTSSAAPPASSLGPPATGSLSPRSAAAYRSVSPQPPQQQQAPVSPSRDYRAVQQGGGGVNMTPQQYAEYQQRKLMMQQQQQQQQQQQHHRSANNGQQLDPRAQQQQAYGGGTGGGQRYSQEQLMAMQQQQRERERQHQQQQQQHAGYPAGYSQTPLAHSPNPAGPAHMQQQQYAEQQRR